MKFNAIKLAFSATALLAASGFAMQAQAHCLTQSIATANPSAFQQDVYNFVCPTGTASVVGKASLISGTQLAYQIGKGGFTFASTTDTTASAAATCTTAVGPGGFTWEILSAGTVGPISINGGPGVYTLVASKSTTAAATYGIEFHCMTGANGTGTELQPASGVWEQGGPLSVAGTGLTDGLDAVSGSSSAANDTNTDVNLTINH